jgi:hypothetical protein
MIGAMSLRAATVAVAVFAGVTSGSAIADTKFDGSWLVEAVATEGACEDRRIVILVRDGDLSLIGVDAETKGTVNFNGRLKVKILHGADRVTVNGALTGALGKGNWSSDGCAGRWTAQRS